MKFTELGFACVAGATTVTLGSVAHAPGTCLRQRRSRLEVMAEIRCRSPWSTPYSTATNLNRMTAPGIEAQGTQRARSISGVLDTTASPA